MTAPSNPSRNSKSLTQDALRRLRKNRVGMLSVAVLVSVGLLALLTPLLPLQPPDAVNTRLKLAAPTLAPLMVDTFAYDPEVRRTFLAEVPAAEQAVLTANERLAAEPHSLDAQRAAQNARSELRSLVQRPYTDAGYPRLGPLARGMVRLRYTWFGVWEINSVCGRDKLGRDLLSRIFWGSRVSLIVGVVATLVSLVIGVTWGAVAGYAGGAIDNLLMRIVDVLYSVPFIFVVILLITFLSEESRKAWLDSYGIDRITVFYFVVGAIYWLTMARVVRGQVLSLRREPFVEAARAIGVSHAGVLARHILPNLLSVILVYLTLTIPRVILFEAFLSFLGMGVEPPDVSWGLLANEGIQVLSPVKTYWWLVLFPSAAIGTTLFALNFFGDALRDAFDPKLASR